nr:BTAD domain-containing putative transcriptional regulator [Deinobacterium chartae]
MGVPSLIRPDGAAQPLERRTAALLTYLAVEGPTPRSRLAQLFWPDSAEAVARNNLVQALRRLDKLAGTRLVDRSHDLTLSSDVQVDLVETLRGQPVPETGLIRLEGLELDNAPDFMQWLLATREQAHRAREQASRQAIDDALAAGDIAAALMLVQQLLELDPLSEYAHRTLMQLHLLDGDRAAALQVYQRYKDLLARELGEAPPHSIERLVGDEGGSAAADPVRIPLAVLRPPRLVGREETWRRMEEAWEAGKTIYLVGAAGTGKTRLAQDFARSKGAALYLRGQPGEQHVPFAGAVRNARARLAAAPHVRLPEWVIQELARVMPEFQRGRGSAPPPLLDEQDRLNFFQAHLEMVRLTSPGFVATITDDVHYYDQATMELGVFFLSQGSALGGHGEVPRHIITYRPDELTAAAKVMVDRHVDAGSAVRISVTPLAVSDVTDLLVALAVPDAEALADALWNSTGGNAQFLLEAVRHMYETGQFSADAALDYAQGSISNVIQQRLGKLSPIAIQAARAAAVLQNDISIERVSEVLQLPLPSVMAAWEELEQAQVMLGERFSHDLVQESVRMSLPTTARRILHRAAARMLVLQGAPAGVIAQHWLEAGDMLQAAKWLEQAGEEAAATLRLQEAEELYREAGKAYASAQEGQGAFKVWRRTIIDNY